jgi:orotidine-5'-phosphate decarboxylase
MSCSRSIAVGCEKWPLGRHPAQAIAAGADYLVVRPIVKSEDPARAAARIIGDMCSTA